MHRSMMQVYVKDSGEAFKFYRKAFNAKVLCHYLNDDGTSSHSELDIFGQVLAIAELFDDTVHTGSTMQFCLHFGEGKESIVQEIYGVLKDGAKILYPLGSIDYSPMLMDLIDRYGVRWCIFV